jgi:hypothetical protein
VGTERIYCFEAKEWDSPLRKSTAQNQVASHINWPIGAGCVCISSSGTKLWRWRYRFDGKEKMMALGEYPLVTLNQARELHFAVRQTLAAGIDRRIESAQMSIVT